MSRNNASLPGNRIPYSKPSASRYHVHIVYIEPSVATILEQNGQRPNSVPESVILRLLEKLDPPGANEAHEVQLFPL
jgi:tRNA uridine 5-carbamoylmethylation protein Kti12